MSALHTTGETVDELTADMLGVWLVTTEGSRSIWDLEDMTYTRTPLNDGISGPRLWDGETKPILQVLKWPQIGHPSGLSFIRDDVPREEGLVVRTRLTSEVQSIERLEPDQAEAPTAPEEASETRKDGFHG